MYMNDESDTHAPRPSDTVGRLEEARHKAGWLSWGGFTLAITWWASAIGGTIALLGWQTIAAAQPALIIAGTVILLLPGFMLLMAGFLAREQIRASAANAIVLEAAAKLLTPAEEMGREALVFANQMSQASAEVDKSMGHALSAMRAMASEIGDERQRLESVTYASADNARDLADRLGAERTALEQLTRELREQTALIGEAVPRQAGMIVESARAAAQEVAAAEEALDARLTNLENTGRSLSQKIGALDTLAAEAGQRNETLLFAIARMEESSSNLGRRLKRRRALANSPLRLPARQAIASWKRCAPHSKAPAKRAQKSRCARLKHLNRQPRPSQISRMQVSKRQPRFAPPAWPPVPRWILLSVAPLRQRRRFTIQADLLERRTMAAVSSGNLLT